MPIQEAQLIREYQLARHMHLSPSEQDQMTEIKLQAFALLLKTDFELEREAAKNGVK